MAQPELQAQDPAEAQPLCGVEATCMRNLLSTAEEVIYFKDRSSRYLLVSAGWIAGVAPGKAPEEIVGKTDFDFFDVDYASAAFEDEQQIMRTGEPIVGKLELEAFHDSLGNWMSTTKTPLRDGQGAIIGTFGISRNVTAQVHAENALAQQALQDPVTGLANRTALMDHLSRALVAMDRHPGQVAVLFVDLDHFKYINDSFGHEAGDRVLIEVGHRLSSVARRADTVARIGGDEFVVMCTELHAEDDVRHLADRFVRAVSAPYAEGGRALSLSCSVGVVVTGNDRTPPAELLRNADAAMYEAKQAGRDRFQIYGAAPHAPRSHSALEDESSAPLDRWPSQRQT